MNVYGFDYNNVFFLLSKLAVTPVTDNTDPSTTDTSYNTAYTFLPNAVRFNNPGLPIDSSKAELTKDFPDWISTLNNKLDLRGYYLSTDPNDLADGGLANSGYYQIFKWRTEVLSTKSNITKLPVAFTPETIFYAQSAYFATIVMVQWSNVFACKSRKVTMR